MVTSEFRDQLVWQEMKAREEPEDFQVLGDLLVLLVLQD